MARFQFSIAYVIAFFANDVIGKLLPNSLGEAQELRGSTIVCLGRSSTCSVLLDVPQACAGEASNCPVALMLHGRGGKNTAFNGNPNGVHAYGIIGVYPQGEFYGFFSGWNDGSLSSNRCAWDDFNCTLDPNDGVFIAHIIVVVKGLGATGRWYGFGTSNGANEIQILSANGASGESALPFVAIVAQSGQLLAQPPRSGPAPYNYNQPCAGNRNCSVFGKVAQLSLHGTGDSKIPYDGGPRFNSDVFILETEADSDVIWKTQNGCTGPLVNETVPAKYPHQPYQDTVATHFAWTGCPEIAPVEYYAVHGAPHGAASSINGKDVMTIVFDFFARVERAYMADKFEFLV